MGSETGFFSCHSERSEESHDFLGEVKGLRNRVFPKYFVVTDRFGKKPGFLDLRMGLRNRVFPKYFVVTNRFWKKPGFF